MNQKSRHEMGLTTHGCVNPAGVQVIEQLLDESTIKSAVYWHEIDSTNAQAIDDLGTPLSTDEFPRMYLTDNQTSGRGRHGRKWQSSLQNLAFSITFAIPSSNPPPLLSLSAGVAAARAIEFVCAPIRCRLKWPNDVYIDGGKVAGVLIESRPHADRFVIGVGVNVGEAPELQLIADADDNPNPIRPKSISDSISRSASKFELLEAIVSQLVAVITTAQDDVSVLKDYRERCMLSGKPISLSSANGEKVSGICEGISESGDLVVGTASGSTTFRSGEASEIRPS